MITSLSTNELDIGIGLTEAWVSGLAKAGTEGRAAPYALVGTYVESPLRWAISTGGKRKDIGVNADPGEWVKELRGRKMGVSRVGSGSYVMGFVVADKMGWLTTAAAAATAGTGEEQKQQQPFEVVPLQTFEKLREGVNSEEGGAGAADFFMWEHFTSKRYFDNGEIRKIGEILTPWPGWHVVAKPELVGDERLEEFFTLVDQGVEWFAGHGDEAVEYISTELDYSKEDAEEWMRTVQFAKELKGVRRSVVDETLTVLKKAGVVEEGVKGDEMVKIRRKEPGLLSALTGS